LIDRRKVNKGLNLGDILHILTIVTLVFSMGVAYQKFDANAIVTNIHTQQLDRIEHYLSSKDKDYWGTSRRNE
jgi:hypothetical protein